MHHRSCDRSARRLPVVGHSPAVAGTWAAGHTADAASLAVALPRTSHRVSCKPSSRVKKPGCADLDTAHSAWCGVSAPLMRPESLGARTHRSKVLRVASLLRIAALLAIVWLLLVVIVLALLPALRGLLRVVAHIVLGGGGTQHSTAAATRTANHMDMATDGVNVQGTHFYRRLREFFIFSSH